MKVLLFSSYRDAAGQRELELTLPTGATVRDAAARLEADYPDLKLKGALAARNEVYAGPDEALEAGDTLAFFPPVAGGSGEPEDWFFVTDKALDVSACLAYVSDAKYGAVSSFLGTVRSPNHGQPVLYIDYEGYEAMIVSQMKRAAAELRALADFYRSPTGQALMKKQPLVVRDINRATGELMGARVQTAMKSIQPQIEAELKRLQAPPPAGK